MTKYIVMSEVEFQMHTNNERMQAASKVLNELFEAFHFKLTTGEVRSFPYPPHPNEGIREKINLLVQTIERAYRQHHAPLVINKMTKRKNQ